MIDDIAGLEPPTSDDRLIWDVWLSVYHFPTLAVADALGVSRCSRRLLPRARKSQSDSRLDRAPQRRSSASSLHSVSSSRGEADSISRT